MEDGDELWSSPGQIRLMKSFVFMEKLKGTGLVPVSRRPAHASRISRKSYVEEHLIE